MSNVPVKYQPQQTIAATRGVEIRSLGDLQQFAQIAEESGMFKDLKGAAQAAIKIQRGLELGLAPMEAMSSLHVMEGKVAMSAQLMAAMVRRAGYRYQIVEHTYERCELRWIDPQGHELGHSSFSLEDAKKAGLAGRGNWSKFAREMLFARAVSQGARWFAPEVLLGCYLPDELEPAEPVEPTKPPPLQFHHTKEQAARVIEAAIAPQGGQHSPAPVVEAEPVGNPRGKFFAIAAELNLSEDEQREFLGVKSRTEISPEGWMIAADRLDQGREALVESLRGLMRCMTMDELRDAWGGVPIHLRGSLNTAKESAKRHIEGGEG